MMIDFIDKCPKCGTHHLVRIEPELCYDWYTVCECGQQLELDWDYLEDRNLTWIERRVNYRLFAVREDRKTCL